MNNALFIIFALYFCAFSEIGDWNNDGCKFALISKAEAEFRLLDANTGFATLYNGPSASSLVTATLVDMATNYGYIYNLGNAYYNFDGINDHVTTTCDMILSNTSKQTIMCNIIPGSNNTLIIFCGFYESSADYWYFGRNTSNQIIIAFKVGNIFRRATGSSTILLGDTVNVCFTKDSSTLKLYVNGVQESYINQDTYDIGSKTFSYHVGRWNTFYYDGQMTTQHYYIDAKDSLWIVETALLGDSLGGLRGRDNGNGTMLLTSTPDVNLRQSKHFRFGDSFMEWSKRLLRVNAR